MATVGSVTGQVLGGIGGGVGGFFLGGPAGAIGGAGLGANIGGGIGGLIDPEDQPQIPTRSTLGIEGDAAFADTAGVFRQQLAAQLGIETAGINRAFGGAGRFTSGQRLGAIERAQGRASGAFGQFLRGTALERFLQQQRLQTQSDIAMAQIEAQRGGGRTQLVGQGVGALAQIFASNPEFFINLFKGDGGVGTTGGSSANTLAFRDLKG